MATPSSFPRSYDGHDSTQPHGPQATASDYYNHPRHGSHLSRTLSMSAGGQAVRRPNTFNKTDTIHRARRLSHDEKGIKPRKFLMDVEETLRIVLEQEDTDGNYQISITDSGPKVLSVGTATSNGFKSFDLRGTYMLSNLLQELAFAREYGRKYIVLDESRLTETPVERLTRMIKHLFWNGLTRRIDGDGLATICADPKNRSRHQNPRIYVPEGEPEMIEYYRQVAKDMPHLKLQVDVVPKNFDAEYVKSLNEKPGLLALAMKKTIDPETGKMTLEGIPFTVPGARFNELYNWDSYFMAIGLLVDGKVELAKGIIDHFCFEILHYGKILNGSRSYYLMRSQPCFLTDLALQVYHRLPTDTPEENKEWLKKAIRAAIKEYHTVWTAVPRLDTESGLSRYRPDGVGIPPETEASHFTHILQPFAEKHGISVNEFCDAYNDGEIKEPELDTYFMHDRAVRESGLDTTYRFEKKCADLATIDLNCLLFKYEVDIASAIENVFGDELTLEEEFALGAFPLGTEVPYTGEHPEVASCSSTSRVQKSAEWLARAQRRKQLVDHYMYNPGTGLWFDWDTRKKKCIRYESVTSFWTLWCGMATAEQAERLVKLGLPKFEVAGGLVCGTEESRGKITLDRPNRQWDYPTAWAPHQMLAWAGLERYGYLEDAQRIAYRWLYMIVTGFANHNGLIAEKFDAVKLSHNVTAEYGNQGLDFTYVPREGFGWTNASIQVGLTYVTQHQRRALGALTSPETFFRIPPIPIP